MIECERCGDAVDRVLRHREHGMTVTHRVTRWLCHDCHPTAPRQSRTGADETDGSSGAVVTDGGTSTACPQCDASTVNVHGIDDCTQCRWNGH